MTCTCNKEWETLTEDNGRLKIISLDAHVGMNRRRIFDGL